MSDLQFDEDLAILHGDRRRRSPAKVSASIPTTVSAVTLLPAPAPPTVIANHEAALAEIRHQSIPQFSDEDASLAIETIEKRLEKDRSQLIWVYQIPATTCKGSLREITLRELLQELVVKVNRIDAIGRRKVAKTRKVADGSLLSEDEVIRTPSTASVSLAAPFSPAVETKRRASQTDQKPKGGLVGISVEVDPFESSRDGKAISPARRSSASSSSAAQAAEAPESSRTPPLDDADVGGAAMQVRIRDLRRLDFLVNPNIEFSVQVCDLDWMLL
jgi:hypothetical protein